MTPSEQLAYLRSYAARKPNARLGSAIERLAVMNKVDALRESRPSSQAASALHALAGHIRAGMSVVANVVRESR